MPMHLHSLEQMAAFAANSPSIPKDVDRAEVRVYATVLTGAAFWSMLVSALHLLGVETSAVYTVGALTGMTVPLALLLLLAALLTLPHLFSLIFLPYMLHKRLPRKIAALGTAVAAVLWAVLGNLARPLDLGFLPWIYWASAVGYLIVSAAYGYSLNAQQARKEIEKCGISA